MIALTPALGLLYALVGSTLAMAAPTELLSERASSFNPRQKWQRNEVNCIQILNPSAGATYRPGYFVRMNYGASQCEGVTAAGPWTIHLYNNPEFQGGKVRYDYHEVIADGINEYKTQYTWTIPANQDTKAKIQKAGDYYVRVETQSAEGIKLVGNAGPFAIYPQNPPLSILKREEDTVQDPLANFDASFALRPKPSAADLPLPEPSNPTAPKTGDAAPVVDTPVAADVGKQDVPQALDQALVSDVPHAVSDSAPAAIPAPESIPTAIPESAPAATAETSDTTSDLSSYPVPVPHNLPPEADIVKPPVTPISHGSLIPGKALVVGAVSAGAIAAGIAGGMAFGKAGAALGTVLGGIIGGLAVLLSYVGVPA